MAIFGTSKKKGEKKAEGKKRFARAHKLPEGRQHSVILHPWFTEKALLATEKGVYAFAVPREATKGQIAGAIEELYKVKPKAVRIVNLPAKTVSMRTRRGTASRARRRKAYVYLNSGDTIQFA